jgi:hypothetical protein
MKSLTWNQVNAWRLAQHGLAPRLQHEAFVEVTSRLYGIHAQVMSAAELALAARTDGLTAQDVQLALWQNHTLVKTWAMRGTLHLLAAGDLTTITVEMFDPPAKLIRKGIESEAARLAGFFNTVDVLEYGPIP